MEDDILKIEPLYKLCPGAKIKWRGAKMKVTETTSLMTHELDTFEYVYICPDGEVSFNNPIKPGIYLPLNQRVQVLKY